MKAAEQSKCFECEYHRKIYTTIDFRITGFAAGCTYPPYRGKWVAELTECPKDKEECENND